MLEQPLYTEPNKKKTNKALIWIMVIMIIFITNSCAFMGGAVVIGVIQELDGYSVDVDTSDLESTVTDIYEVLDKNALVPPDKDKLEESVIKGILLSLDDPYAYYFTPEEYQSFIETEEGSFGGIGVVLGENENGQTYVVNVMEDTPAFDAGVKEGDIFYSVDGVKKDKWTTEQIMKLVRGEPGTKVVVGFLRGDVIKPVELEITREIIKVPNIEKDMLGENKDIGYVRLYQFNMDSARDVESNIQTLLNEGATSIILDLRENPGGLLQTSVDIVSLFVESGDAVIIQERESDEYSYQVSGNKITDVPVVVLIDGNSASASEIVAGALQDYERATIVGETSFGKGTVQNFVEMDNGGAMKFTIAHYLTPKRQIIDGNGVTPDVEVKMEVSAQNEYETDTQLQKAVEILDK